MPFALLPLPKMTMIGKCLNTWTCSPEKPTSVPFKGNKSDVSMFIPFKVSQYKMSDELPRSINTLFTLQSWISTFMTNGSFSFARTPSESHFKKPMTIDFPSFLDRGFYDMCITDRTYIFLDELISPSPTKPPEMVLNVCRVTRFSHISAAFSFLGRSIFWIWISFRRAPLPLRFFCLLYIW